MIDSANNELAIFKLVARLAQAADDRDEVAYLACLARTVDCDPMGEGRVAFQAAVYARDSIARVAKADWTHHRLTNPVVTVEPDGSRARARVDVEVALAYCDETGARHRAAIGGRYDLGFVRVNGTWRIDRRVLHERYADGMLPRHAFPSAPPPSLEKEDTYAQI